MGPEWSESECSQTPPNSPREATGDIPLHPAAGGGGAQSLVMTPGHLASAMKQGIPGHTGHTGYSSTLAGVRQQQAAAGGGGALPHGGALPYAAPEVLDGTAPGDLPSDVYALGVLLWELVSDGVRRPFEGLNAAQTVLAKGRRGGTADHLGFSPGTDEEYVQLCRDCWSDASEERPSAGEVVSASIYHTECVCYNCCSNTHTHMSMEEINLFSLLLHLTAQRTKN